MVSKYFFSLKNIKPHQVSDSGSATIVTTHQAPGFVNISYCNLRLNRRGSIEPIWHPNAHKVGYCVQGSHLVSIRTPSDSDVFTVQKGEMFFIPKGCIHHIENIGDNEGIIHFALDNTHPETMHLSQAVGSISDSVFNSTFNTPKGFVGGLNRGKEHIYFKTLPALTHPINPIKSPYKFDIENSNKAILTKGGYVQLGTHKTLPVLQGLGILGFGLNPKGIVEPHWHTNAGELVFIVKGNTKITVLHPDGNVNVMEVNAGEGAFAPASHFHNIENVGSEDVEVIAFFTNADPDYIGIGEVIGSYSNQLLASVFNTSPDYFEVFKKPEEPLVIVPV